MINNAKTLICNLLSEEAPTSFKNTPARMAENVRGKNIPFYL